MLILIAAWPSLEPLLQNDDFLYPVQVQGKDTGIGIPNATVIIRVRGMTIPLDGVTDNKGFARISIPASYKGKPGRLVVSSNDYHPYQLEIDLNESLPDIIPLEPILIETPTPVKPIPISGNTPTPTPNEVSDWSPCQIESFMAEPLSPQPVGTLIIFPITATCKSGVRAIRLMINGEWQSEKGGHIAPPDEFVPTWNTKELEPGIYEITAEVATWEDNDWEFSASESIEYILTEE